jgi:hypothetical protein
VIWTGMEIARSAATAAREKEKVRIRKQELRREVMRKKVRGKKGKSGWLICLRALNDSRVVHVQAGGEKAYSNFPPMKALLRDRKIGGCALSFPGDSRRASAFRNSEFRISKGAKSNHARNPSEVKPS